MGVSEASEAGDAKRIGRGLPSEVRSLRRGGASARSAGYHRKRRSSMQSRQEVLSFIRATFRSVWSLELLLFLKQHPERAWAQQELVSALRGSDALVSQSIDALVAAGLLTIRAEGTSHYGPASDDIRRLADGTEELYAKSPDAVRRTIISSANGGLTAFADAFKLKKD